MNELRQYQWILMWCLCGICCYGNSCSVFIYIYSVLENSQHVKKKYKYQRVTSLISSRYARTFETRLGVELSEKDKLVEICFPMINHHSIRWKNSAWNYNESKDK